MEVSKVRIEAALKLSKAASTEIHALSMPEYTIWLFKSRQARCLPN
jgi:hypothetical protein